MITTNNKYKKTTLPNGTRIVFESNKNLRSCSMGVWIASGSRYETPETSGTSHFIEHMLFRGTQKRSALEIAEQIDEIGGALNAYTAKEYTCFYARCLTEHASKAFDIIGDMINNPKLAAEDIELEKGVITEEIAMYEDSPEDLCTDVFYDRLWQADMLGRNILGTRETVAAMTRERLVSHMQRFYVPERIVISFCGNFDSEAMLEKCREYFGAAEPTGNPLTASEPEYKKNTTVFKKEFEQNQIMLGFPGLPMGDRRRYTVQLLGSILGASSSSRLFQRIREELGLAYSIDCANASFINTGVFIVSMGLSARSERRAINETVKVLMKFASSVTERELSIAKEQAAAGLIMGLESVSAKASFNARNELIFGRIENEADIERKIRAVTLDDIKSMAEWIFDFDKASLCAVGKVRSADWYKKQIAESRKEAENA